MAANINIIRFLFSNVGPIFPNIAATVGVNLFYSPRRFEKKAAEKDIEQYGETFYFNSRKGKLKLYHWKGKRSENVLLVHGWEGRATQLHKFVQPILNEGFSVLAFDGPAHGDSEGKKTTLPFFSQAIEDICQTYRVKYIIAHSFGAGGSAIAISNGLSIDKAVFISAPFSVENVVNRFGKYLKIPYRVSEKMHKIMENEKWHAKSRECFSFHTLGKTIDIPLLIIHDKRDKYVSYEDGCKIHECCKNSEFMSTDGYGHGAIIEKDVVINRSMEFLFR